MSCLHCGTTGVIVDTNDGCSVEFYCEHCDLGRHLNKQVCSGCGGWRGPVLAGKGAPPCQCKRPTAGDTVLLTAPWSIAPAGSWGVIGGMVNVHEDFLHICFRAGCFNNGHYVSCSGGPATIALPAFLLDPTPEVRDQDFWTWQDTPRAGGGVYYSKIVPVWHWDGFGLIMREDGTIVRLD